MAHTKKLSKSPKTQADPFSVSLETGGVVYNASADSALSAIENLNLDYTKIKYKGVLTLRSGGKESSRFMHTHMLKRLFANKLFRVYTSKNLVNMLS